MDKAFTAISAGIEDALRSPRGVARVLLRVVERNPKAEIAAVNPLG